MEYQKGAVSPSGSISAGWNNIKDNYWTFFVMTLITGIILFILSIIFGFINSLVVQLTSAALGTVTQNSGNVGAVSAAVVPQLIAKVIGIFTSIIVLTVSGVLFCGIYKALSRQSKGEAADIGDLFGEFQKIVPCLIVAVILSLVQFVIEIIGILTGAAIGVSVIGAGILTSDGKLNPALFGGLFLVIMVFLILYIIVSLIISALTSFTYPLIAEQNLSGGQALLLSIKSGLSNFGGLLGLMALLFLMAFGGFLLCCIGIFFVAPIMSAALFAAFQSVFGGVTDFRQNTPPPPPNFGNQAGY
ncbi:MAG: hypothetical protein ACR2J3_09025 [Aridibacter sp.]